MVICLDIDGILCRETEGFSYAEALVIPDSVVKVKEFTRRGFSIIYYTSRPEMDRLVTANWLQKNGYPNAPLFMGKPQADVYIDDRAISSLEEL